MPVHLRAASRHPGRCRCPAPSRRRPPSPSPALRSGGCGGGRAAAAGTAPGGAGRHLPRRAPLDRPPWRFPTPPPRGTQPLPPAGPHGRRFPARTGSAAAGAPAAATAGRAAGEAPPPPGPRARRHARVRGLTGKGRGGPRTFAGCAPPRGRKRRAAGAASLRSAALGEAEPACGRGRASGGPLRLLPPPEGRRRSLAAGRPLSSPAWARRGAAFRPGRPAGVVAASSAGWPAPGSPAPGSAAARWVFGGGRGREGSAAFRRAVRCCGSSQVKRCLRSLSHARSHPAASSYNRKSFPVFRRHE